MTSGELEELLCCFAVAAAAAAWLFDGELADRAEVVGV
jgi:hypothetical protein